VAQKYKENVDVEAIRPTVDWRSTASELSTAGAGAHAPADAGSQQ
jgi:hypothetical protein